MPKNWGRASAPARYSAGSKRRELAGCSLEAPTTSKGIVTSRPSLRSSRAPGMCVGTPAPIIT